MKDRQPPLYLLTGIIFGVLLGLLIAYVILPVRYSNTEPNTLSNSQKGIYRALIARAYLYEADSGRAQSRLALLQDQDPGTILAAQAQKLLAAGGDPLSARGLALLAAGLTQPDIMITPITTTMQPTATSVVIEPTFTVIPALTSTSILSVTSTPVPMTATPFATLTPRPSATPKPTQGAPYKFVNQKDVCESGQPKSLLMVYVFDSAGEGVAGVKIEITPAGGGTSDFYTGLYPEISNGYADYQMTMDATYSLRVGIGGDLVSDLAIPECGGSLELDFKQQ